MSLFPLMPEPELAHLPITRVERFVDAITAALAEQKLLVIELREVAAELRAERQAAEAERPAAALLPQVEDYRRRAGWRDRKRPIRKRDAWAVLQKIRRH